MPSISAPSQLTLRYSSTVPSTPDDHKTGRMQREYESKHFCKHLRKHLYRAFCNKLVKYSSTSNLINNRTSNMAPTTPDRACRKAGSFNYYEHMRLSRSPSPAKVTKSRSPPQGELKSKVVVLKIPSLATSPAANPHLQLPSNPTSPTPTSKGNGKTKAPTTHASGSDTKLEDASYQDMKQKIWYSMGTPQPAIGSQQKVCGTCEELKHTSHFIKIDANGNISGSLHGDCIACQQMTLFDSFKNVNSYEAIQSSNDEAFCRDMGLKAIHKIDEVEAALWKAKMIVPREELLLARWKVASHPLCVNVMEDVVANLGTRDAVYEVQMRQEQKQRPEAQEVTPEAKEAKFRRELREAHQAGIRGKLGQEDREAARILFRISIADEEHFEAARALVALSRGDVQMADA